MLRKFLQILYYAAFTPLFCLCRLFSVQSGKVVLLRNFPESEGLRALEEELDARGGYRVYWFFELGFLHRAYHLATAGAVFLNINFSPLAWLPFAKATRIVQIWHGEGAWKKWGHSMPAPPPRRFAREMRRTTAAACPSEGVRPYWCEGFGLPPEKVLPLGSPRIDALLRPYDKAALREQFDREHPQCRGKKLFLYAPTFRDEPGRGPLEHFDFPAFRARFGDEAALLVRLHPLMHGTYDLRGTGAIDLTGAPGPLDILRVCDRFVSDYSSLCFAAAALDLPIVLYAYDLEEYARRDRGFYMPPQALPPGPIARDFPALLDALAAPDTSREQRRAFAAFHLGAMDGKAAQRIVDAFC